MSIILEISFLVFNKTNIQINIKSFIWRTYSAAKVLSIIKRIKVINQYKYAIMALGKNSDIFVVHVTALKTLNLYLYLFRALLLATLYQNKALTKIFLKYADYVNIFSHNMVIQLPKNIGINKLAIELIKGKQLLYSSIYSLSPVKLKILKAHIKTYLNTKLI